MKVMLESGAVMPSRAHRADAGMDLYAREEQIILPGESAVFDTGVHVELEPGTFGKLESKSGLNVNYDVVSCGGVIDSGYTGSIRVKLYNLGKRPYMIRQGQKIVQMIVMPCLYPELEQSDTLDETERGTDGFGSSDPYTHIVNQTLRNSREMWEGA
jgi:dUTP pyrophosphatase